MLPTFHSSFITVYSPHFTDWHLTPIQCHWNSKHTHRSREKASESTGEEVTHILITDRHHDIMSSTGKQFWMVTKICKFLKPST